MGFHSNVCVPISASDFTRVSQSGFNFGNPPYAMDIMCQCIHDAGLPPEIAQFITSSIRQSSVKTYESMWKSWISWCSAHNVDREVQSATDLVHYLWFLFREKGLAPATLGVHRTAKGRMGGRGGDTEKEGKMRF